MRKILGSYINGNTFVIMYPDGTKERYIKDNEVPMPEFPESIDLKITNKCDMGCHFCAESSTPDGIHAYLLHPIFDTINPYTELAIGGGNPLEHPDLVWFLKRMKAKKVICNITVNAVHFMKNLGFIHYLQGNSLIHGIGVSVPAELQYGLIDKIKNYKNIVIHTIAGFTPIHTYDLLADHDINLLILGYKVKGRGVDYCSDFYGDLIRRFGLLSERVVDMREHFRAIAFDNLAIKQLNLSERFNPEEMDRLYMGDDGEYTMYIDLVTGKFGKSSSHPLRNINANSVADLFAQVHGEEHYSWQ